MLLLVVLVVGLISARNVDCDIFIAVGSASALAAAFGAAEASTEATICLTEPTDWLGGQMTASGVSAIDFGLI